MISSIEEVLVIAAVLKKQIEELKEKVGDIKKDIAASDESIDNQSERLSDLLDDIKECKTELEAINESIDAKLLQGDKDTNTKLQTLKSQFEVITNRIRAEIGDISTSIASLESKIPPPVSLVALEEKIEAVRLSIPKPQEKTPPFNPSALEFSIEKIVESLDLLREEVEELKKRKPGVLRRSGFGFGLGARELVQDIDLSPKLDGVTKTFNIPAIYKIITVDLSSFPNTLRKNIDYTYTGNTITFTDEIDAASSLAAGQTAIITVINA